MYPILNENDYISVMEDLVRMPDGVGLYTRSIVPKGRETYPIVFQRTPYAKALSGVPCSLEEYVENAFVQNGYALVIQHCRGTGDSEGICIPYENEREDGLVTLDQIRKFPFYQGEIYVCGRSYLATVHLSYFDTNPADIKGAALSIQTDRMYFRNYRNGCCYNFCNLDWWLSMMKRSYPTADKNERIHRPYKDIMKRIVGEDVPQYTAGLMNDTNNAFWQDDPRTRSMDKLDIPILLTEGWYDFYIQGMFEMWERLPKKTKEKSALVVGPWGHKTRVSQKAEYPFPNGNVVSDYAVEWFNSIRTGTPYKYAKCGKVNYYSIGGDEWSTTEYPGTAGEEKQFQRLYFGCRNTLTQIPGTSGELSYTYDPSLRLDCFPYHDIFKAKPMGVVEGVLSFQTEPFVKKIDFFGKIRWHMYVKTNCEDTAFFIRIYFTDGEGAYNLTETITSLSCIDKNYQAGERILIDVETPPIAFTVKEGGCIRVDIASDGGIYVPHANIKGHWAEVIEERVAVNTVICDEEAYIEYRVVSV